jgi:hypothetical protein
MIAHSNILGSGAKVKSLPNIHILLYDPNSNKIILLNKNDKHTLIQSDKTDIHNNLKIYTDDLSIMYRQLIEQLVHYNTNIPIKIIDDLDRWKNSALNNKPFTHKEYSYGYKKDGTDYTNTVTNGFPFAYLCHVGNDNKDKYFILINLSIGTNILKNLSRNVVTIEMDKLHNAYKAAFADHNVNLKSFFYSGKKIDYSPIYDILCSSTIVKDNSNMDIKHDKPPDAETPGNPGD